MIRQLSTRYYHHCHHHQGLNKNNVRSSIEFIINSTKFIGTLLRTSLKDQSTNVIRVWIRQCECVFAQRLRRGQQMLCVYSRLWEERALHEFFRQLRTRYIRMKTRDLLFASIGVVAYDWSKNRISESEIRKHVNELAYVYKLKDKTLCDRCDKSSRICHCEGSDDAPKSIMKTFDDWSVFIKKQDMVVWRRLHNSGCYEYKVYASYPDVTAEDFLNVQIDIEYRKQWDATAVALSKIEEDPTPHSNSDIIYWEMLWPKLFANRDYVFNRRYLVDHKNNTLFLVSKSTKHPSCPKDKTKYRIEDYWSYMVIKPYTELNKNGIEFSLTYYDNPGINIPASVTTWVAMKAMPDFLERLRDASKKYRIYCKEKGVCQVCNIMDTKLKEEMDLSGMQDENANENDASKRFSYFDDDMVNDNTIYEPDYSRRFNFKVENEQQKFIELDSEENSSGSNSSNVEPERSGSYWRSEDLDEDQVVVNDENNENSNDNENNVADEIKKE